MVAASEGSLEAVKMLVSLGADLSQRDLRGNDARKNAIREQKQDVVAYINSLLNDLVIIDYCKEFGDGILTKGI
jgi:ankyrin repeat protein